MHCLRKLMKAGTEKLSSMGSNLYGWEAGQAQSMKAMGNYNLIIEDRANDEQREAIRRIVYNEDTDDLLTHYAVFCAMSTTIYDPIVAPINLNFDVEARTLMVKSRELLFPMPNRCEIPLQENHIGRRSYYPKDLVAPCWKLPAEQLKRQGLYPWTFPILLRHFQSCT